MRPTPTAVRCARRIALSLYAVAIAGSLGGCAQHVTVQGNWKDGVAHNQTFTRVLVVGASPDVDTRCAFEWALASRIKSATVQAVASCDAMSLSEPLTRETITAAVAKLQPDVVVSTSLVSMKLANQEGGGRDTRGAGYYKATGAGFETGYYGGYGIDDTYVIYGEYQTAPSIMTTSGQFHLTTKLYETATQKPVYVMSTEVKAKDLGSRDAVLAMITAPIAAKLRRDGLIR